MFARILHELREHSSFTIFGAVSGILVMIASVKMPHEVAHDIFYVLHPLHVVLSALVTASLYSRYRCGQLGKKCPILLLLVIGYVGSIGIATLSDSVIPYLGEVLLNLPHRQVHIGFIEKWWLINPLAFLGIAIAYFWPTTKFPHAGHVLVSTWASLFHIIMAAGGPISWFSYAAIFLFLFLSVWLPCCISDIIFPLLFVRKNTSELHGITH
ncbi:hypothetical protein ACFL1E_04660 [Candidatus Omnitrophota bacterium]